MMNIHSYSGSMRSIRYLLWWIFFMAPAEYIINVWIIPGASFNKFLSTVFLYTVLLTICYFLRRKSWQSPESRKQKLIEAIVLGTFWLFVIEWIMVGNSPWWNPSAFQSSMFIWWIWVFLFPKVMVIESCQPLRKSILRYQIFYSLCFPVIIALTKNPLAFVFVYAFWLWVFYYFLYRYITLESLLGSEKSLPVL